MKKSMQLESSSLVMITKIRETLTPNCSVMEECREKIMLRMKQMSICETIDEIWYVPEARIFIILSTWIHEIDRSLCVGSVLLRLANDVADPFESRQKITYFYFFTLPTSQPKSLRRPRRGGKGCSIKIPL